jgi:outer membrane receptor protein involved in Fe transport
MRFLTCTLTMNFSRLLSLTILGLAPAIPTFAAAADAPVELDPIAITADKEKLFSLPLDAAPSSGSRLGLTNRDLPVSVSVVTQEVMQLRGLRTAVEAVEAAVGMTGGTQFGSIPTYSTRGFGSNSVSIMRDGIRQNTASQSSRTVDSFLLDRVEVLKGPASLMFGEGAIGGAVNYLSKSPSRRRPRRGLRQRRRLGQLPARPRLGRPAALGSKEHPVTVRLDYSHNETNGYVDRNAQRYDAVAARPRVAGDRRPQALAPHDPAGGLERKLLRQPVVYDAVVNTTLANAPVEVRAFNGSTDRLVNARVDPAARTHQLQHPRQLRADGEHADPAARRAAPHPRPRAPQRGLRRDPAPQVAQPRDQRLEPRHPAGGPALLHPHLP